VPRLTPAATPPRHTSRHLFAHQSFANLSMVVRRNCYSTKLKLLLHALNLQRCAPQYSRGSVIPASANPFSGCVILVIGYKVLLPPHMRCHRCIHTTTNCHPAHASTPTHFTLTTPTHYQGKHAPPFPEAAVRVLRFELLMSAKSFACIELHTAEANGTVAWSYFVDHVKASLCVHLRMDPL
jgi:hypothetical protein